MRSFQDRRGREWRVELNVGDVERLRASSLALNVLDVVDEHRAEACYTRLSDPVTLVRVLWHLIEDQATAIGVTPEDFGGAMGGDALDDAAAALDQALVDFFPRSLRRVMEAAQAKIREIETRAADQAVATINDPRTAAAADAMLSRLGTESLAALEKKMSRLTTRSPSATSSPASSELRQSY